MGVLYDILDGFDNQSAMASTLKEFVKILHDPELPYSEVAVNLSSLSGRMPTKLEETIRSAMDVAKAKGDGHDLPAVHIKKAIDLYIQDHLSSQD